MNMPGFVADTSPYRSSRQYRANGQYTQAEAGVVIPTQTRRCPVGCFESNVACTGFLLWNTCWCQSGGSTCPTGGWWLAGGCIGFWQHGCMP
jgi:hypothetical protein